MTKQMEMSDFYEMQKSILSLFGLWPGCDKKQWSLSYKLQKWVTTYFISFSFLISLSVDMYVRCNSIEQLADASYYFTTHLSYVLKLICFRLRYEDFKYLVTENLKLLGGRKDTCHPWFKISNTISQSFLFMCYFTTIFYCVWPLIDTVSILPMGGWFPWEVERSMLGRTTAYIFQSLGILIGVTVNANMDMLVISLLLATCWQVSYEHFRRTVFHFHIVSRPSMSMESLA